MSDWTLVVLLVRLCFLELYNLCFTPVLSDLNLQKPQRSGGVTRGKTMLIIRVSGFYLHATCLFVKDLITRQLRHIKLFKSEPLQCWEIIEISLNNVTSPSPSYFPFLRLLRILSSYVHRGGQHVLAQQRGASSGCMFLTMWSRTAVSGQVSLSAMSIPAMVQSCPFFFIQPLWPTSPCHRRRSCCPIECCATGVPSLTPATLPPGANRQLSAGSSVCLFGRAILTPVAFWLWTSLCVPIRKPEPETIYVISGTSWASTREGTGWACCSFVETRFKRMALFPALFCF